MSAESQPHFKLSEELFPTALTEPVSKLGAPRRLQVQCTNCGRFAKWAGDRHYYNGSYNCYSFDVNCSQCGIVTVECV